MNLQDEGDGTRTTFVALARRPPAGAGRDNGLDVHGVGEHRVLEVSELVPVRDTRMRRLPARSPASGPYRLVRTPRRSHPWAARVTSRVTPVPAPVTALVTAQGKRVGAAVCRAESVAG
jgi:hypothetical protein